MAAKKEEVRVMQSVRSQLLQDAIDTLGALEEQAKSLKEALIERGENAVKGRYVAENIDFYGHKFVDIGSIAVSARAHWTALGVVTAFSKKDKSEG